MDLPFPIFSHETTCFFCYMGNSFTFSLAFFSQISAGSKIKDLLTLMGKEVESAPDDVMEF